MSFNMTGAHACVVLIYFIYPLAGVGAHGCVVDTAFHRAGVGLLANCRVVLGI